MKMNKVTMSKYSSFNINIDSALRPQHSTETTVFTVTNDFWGRPGFCITFLLLLRAICGPFNHIHHPPKCHWPSQQRSEQSELFHIIIQNLLPSESCFMAFPRARFGASFIFLHSHKVMEDTHSYTISLVSSGADKTVLFWVFFFVNIQHSSPNIVNVLLM